MKKTSFLISTMAIAVFFCGTASAQTTAFNYQGSLNTSGSPATGNYDFEFVLFDSLSAGTQLGSTLTRSTVAVTSGTFGVSLDFGSQFSGANRFLEVRVRLTGGGAFIPLSPRSPVTSAPYSVKSLTADSSATATNATSAVNFSGQLTGDVTGLQNATVLINNAVTTTKLADSAVTATKIADGQVVKNVNGLADNVILAAGTNITLTPKGNTLTIASTSGGVGGIGTANPTTIPLWTGGTTLGNSLITQSGNDVLMPNRVILAAGAQGNNITFGSPNNETGMTIAGPNGRADIRFDGAHLKLLAGFPGGPPAITNGITIDFTGKVGIGATDFSQETKFQVRTPGILTGILGYSDGGNGIKGQSISSYGVRGESDNSGGVFGISTNGNGVYGNTTFGTGVRGESFNADLFSGGTSTNILSFRVRNDGQVRSNVGFTTPAADFAEMLPAGGDFEPGDVLVIGRGGKLVLSSRPRQTRVAGVYSTNPGFVGGQAIDSELLNNIPLAMVGIVPVKVTAENGAIRVGDLLTTSSTQGYAMRCNNRLRCVGSTIGKAMETMKANKGVVKMLVTLR